MWQKNIATLASIYILHHRIDNRSAPMRIVLATKMEAANGRLSAKLRRIATCGYGSTTFRPFWHWLDTCMERRYICSNKIKLFDYLSCLALKYVCIVTDFSITYRDVWGIVHRIFYIKQLVGKSYRKQSEFERSRRYGFKAHFFKKVTYQVKVRSKLKIEHFRIWVLRTTNSSQAGPSSAKALSKVRRRYCVSVNVILSTDHFQGLVTKGHNIQKSYSGQMTHVIWPILAIEFDGYVSLLARLRPFLEVFSEGQVKVR